MKQENARTELKLRGAVPFFITTANGQKIEVPLHLIVISEKKDGMVYNRAEFRLLKNQEKVE